MTHITQLFERYYNKTASASERKELMEYIAANGYAEELAMFEKNAWEGLDVEPVGMNITEADTIFRRILEGNLSTAALNHAVASLSSAVPSQASIKHVHFLKMAWFCYAAILLLIVCTATYLWLTTNSNKLTPGHSTTAGYLASPNTNDIAPGGNKAILTLSDGSTIVLDTAANGAIAQQGRTQVIKLTSGELAYHPVNTKDTAASYNTISTPNGGQYQIVLPDGSKVWLNAASSIRFPTAFGKVRDVTITGEVYLEVAADPKKLFTVAANGTNIQVLGTRFNVHAYSDETLLTTTLVDGRVQVTKDQQAILLQPGQQAQVSGSGIKKTTANVDKAVAWKNGLFDFEGSRMAEAMRQLARWYDINVIYPQGVPDLQFGGRLSKRVTLESLLEGLKGFGVHFRLEGRTLVILP